MIISVFFGKIWNRVSSKFLRMCSSRSCCTFMNTVQIMSVSEMVCISTILINNFVILLTLWVTEMGFRAQAVTKKLGKHLLSVEQENPTTLHTALNHCNLVYKNVDIIILAMNYIQEKHYNLKYFESICVFYITLQYNVH